MSEAGEVHLKFVGAVLRCIGPGRVSQRETCRQDAGGSPTQEGATPDAAR